MLLQTVTMLRVFKTLLGKDICKIIASISLSNHICKINILTKCIASVIANIVAMLTVFEA